ncbi:hypothetical protein TUM3792_44310 [Shewanella sp. MBTL60-007]|nr:hypothetical protein TUM3792_44310 [Shewanella sp. MBTL60-007]
MMYFTYRNTEKQDADKKTRKFSHHLSKLRIDMPMANRNSSSH